MALHRENVTVHREASDTGKTDANGNAIYTPAGDIELTLCNVQPVGTNESVGEPEPVTSRWRVSTHKGDVHDEITEDHTVTWRGGEYTILGRPGSFYGIRPHTEFIIEQTEG